MKSSEFASLVADVVKVAQSRINGVGKEQYEQNSMQKFEGMSIPNLLEYFEEELLDQINYAVMNYLRIHNMKLEIRKMLQSMESAGLGQTPAATDMKSGKQFSQRTYLAIQKEVQKELPIEDKTTPLA